MIALQFISIFTMEAGFWNRQMIDFRVHETMSSGEAMAVAADNPIDLTLDAAMELEELRQSLRDDSPALRRLFEYLRSPATKGGEQVVSRLADIRNHEVLSQSVQSRPRFGSPSDFSHWFEKYLSGLLAGVDSRSPNSISDAKEFCLALNRHMLAKMHSSSMETRHSARYRAVNDGVN